jgi:poly(3-hydroxybutyrate) depolymerase
VAGSRTDRVLLGSPTRRLGGALLRLGQRGQASFSIAFGFAAAGAAFAIEVIDYTDRMAVLIATPLYVGTAAWLLQPVAASKWPGSRVATASLVAVRVLALVMVVATAALDILVLRSIDDNRRAEAAIVAQVDGHTQLAALDQGGLRRHFRVYRPNRIARVPGLVILIAAIAPVAGNMATWSGSARNTGCMPVRPVSVLAIQGTADPRVPFQGGSMYAPFSDVIGAWRGIDGCAPSSSTTLSWPTTTTTWRCGGGSVVATKVIAGGGHDWPVGPNRFSPNSTHEAFDASAVIADFFAAHARGMNHAK